MRKQSSSQERLRVPRLLVRKHCSHAVMTAAVWTWGAPPKDGMLTLLEIHSSNIMSIHHVLL